MNISRRKFLLFAVAATSLAVAGIFVLLLAADLFVHHRAERSAGLNRYGYRGPVASRKQAGELRVVMLGGSTVFGYGVQWSESIPAFLEVKLKERVTSPVGVVNLGYNNEGAFSFVPNLEDFAYLDYDVIVLYEGYNDLPGDEAPNRSVYRRNSAMFRMFGYFPILPLYLEEKARLMQYGDLNVAYDALRKKDGASQVVFHPGLAQRTSAVALQAISSMTMALDGQLERSGAAPPAAVKASESKLGCGFPYVTYCESLAAAIRFGLANGKGVVVGLQPRAEGEGRSHMRHKLQQEMLTSMLSREFPNETRVDLADFSTLASLTDPDDTFDGMHLSPPANARIAGALVEHVLKVMPKR